MIYTVTLNPNLDRTLTVPEIIDNEVLRATQVQLDWGGKGLNVSRALKALGGESIVLGFCGGATGAVLTDGLHALGIPTRFIPIANETRTCTVIAEAGSERHIKVNEPGPTTTPDEQAALIKLVAETALPGDYWTLNGSLPPGVPAGFYAGLIELIRSHAARVCLDTSGEALKLGCAACPFLVKPNRAEAAAATGITIRSAADAQRAADVFLQQGVQWVALSLGEEGLLLAARGESVWAKPPKVTIQGPTGAGDALLAGLLWAFEQSLPVEEVARWGVACGTATAMLPGTGVGSRSEVEEIFKLTRVETFRRNVSTYASGTSLPEK